jgi:prepilin-type N-terminal cleavage/methylation domain-containing protein
MKQHRGFTIVEIAVVTLIIGILVSLVLVVYGKVQAQARDSRRESDVRTIMQGLKDYYRDNGEYPLACPTNGTACNASLLNSYLVTKYIPSIPLDPKGTDYQYITSVSDPSAFGIQVVHESTTTCTAGNNLVSTWFSSAPNCNFS